MQEVPHHPWEVQECQELVGSGCCACLWWQHVLHHQSFTGAALCFTGVGVLRGREGVLLGPEKGDFSLLGGFTPKHSPWQAGKKTLIAQSVPVQWKAHQSNTSFYLIFFFL